MRAIIGCFLFVLLLSCNDLMRNNDIREFIPGTYVRAIDHEFAKGSDTLVITLLEGNAYQINKRSGFNRLRNGKVLPFERNTETWTGIYDEKDQVIHEQRKGKLLSFVPKENKLFVGGSAYQKRGK